MSAAVHPFPQHNSMAYDGIYPRIRGQIYFIFHSFYMSLTVIIRTNVQTLSVMGNTYYKLMTPSKYCTLKMSMDTLVPEAYTWPKVYGKRQVTIKTSFAAINSGN
jgi:hypothetical protein